MRSGPSSQSNNKRKALWAHNKTQTNLANQPAPGSKADNSKIAAERNVNNSSVKDKVAAANKVAANRVAVSKVGANRVAVSKVGANRAAAHKVAANSVVVSKVEANRVAAVKNAAVNRVDDKADSWNKTSGGG
jgi:hypothetical protein